MDPAVEEGSVPQGPVALLPPATRYGEHWLPWVRDGQQRGHRGWAGHL